MVDEPGHSASAKSVLPDFLAEMAHQIVPILLVDGVRVQVVAPQLLVPAQLLMVPAEVSEAASFTLNTRLAGAANTSESVPVVWKTMVYGLAVVRS